MSKLDTADGLFRAYVEAIHRYGSAPSPSYTVHSGRITALFCAATKGCGGSPRIHQEEAGRVPIWKCSICKKPWGLERVELSRGAIGGRVAGGPRDATGKRRNHLGRSARLRSSPRRSRSGGGLASTHAAEVLGDVAAALELSAEEDIHAFVAWRTFLFDDAEVRAGRSKSIGLPYEDHQGRASVQTRMLELLEGGLLPPYDEQVTVYRIRRWVSGARRRAIETFKDRRLGVGRWTRSAREC